MPMYQIDFLRKMAELSKRGFEFEFADRKTGFMMILKWRGLKHSRVIHEDEYGDLGSILEDMEFDLIEHWRCRAD